MTEDGKGVKRHFQLRPFTSGSLTGDLYLSGSLSRTAGTLLIEYEMRGLLERVNLPSISTMARRCHELWRHTCFELFFGTQGEPAYWELNLCPSGCWNLYHFAGYRSGMREEETLSAPSCCVVSSSGLLSLTCSLDLNGVIDDSSELQIGVSGIVEETDGRISYWALDHFGRAPDFHNRRSFLVELPGLNDSNTHGGQDEKNCPACL